VVYPPLPFLGHARDTPFVRPLTAP
jgi:hypothetical protein